MVSPFLFSPLLVAGLGAGLERIARVRAEKQYPAPGNLVDAGGYHLHYQEFGKHTLEHGSNAPVILFEADLADWSSHWGTLPTELGESYHVIAYDRAGLGWSEQGTGPRDADSLAKELHQLLIQVAPGRQALLVAHGLGTWVARMYAHRYPFETAGMVLLNGEFEGFADEARRKGLPPSDASTLLLRLLRMGNGLGICRALGMDWTTPPIPDQAFTDRQVETLKVRGYAPSTLRTIQAEQESKDASRAQLEALNDQYEFPVRILASGNSTQTDRAPKGFPTLEHNDLFAQLQENLTGISADARFKVIENAHHYLALGAKQLVRDAVEDALDRATPKSTT